jgi:hypothetical protein
MKALSSGGFLAVGLAIGILLGKTPMLSGGSESSTSSAPGLPTKTDRSSATGSIHPDVSAIRKSTPAGLASLTGHAAMTPDPVESRRLVSECLLNMTAGNWRDVVSSFAKVTSTTGRDPAEDWKLALFRSGQVAGGEAMDSYLADGLKNRGTQAWQTLYGWGTKDPRAALAWLAKAEAEGHATANEHYSAVISGAALSQPEDALKLLGEIPSARRKGCAGNLVWNVVQNGGIDALDPVLEYASNLDTAQPDNKELASELIGEATNKLLWKADHARDVAGACDVVVKLAGYGGDPNGLTLAALQKYRWYFMPDKLNILETISSSPHGSDLELTRLTNTVLGTMNGDQDRTAVREWMEQHPDSLLIPHLRTRVPAE